MADCLEKYLEREFRMAWMRAEPIQMAIRLELSLVVQKAVHWAVKMAG